MRILFNKGNNGQAEMKALLGFLDKDLRFDNIVTDIELNTPGLIEFIGKEIYSKIEDFYYADFPEAPTADQLKMIRILKHAQLYILLLAYLEYAANADLMHGNSGRKIHHAADEKTAWDWQIASDNAALLRRGYKALDGLIDLLDSSDYPEWTGSDQYKESRSLFLYNTRNFDKAYPINNSGQLYYRMVPFMADVETETLRPILGADLFDVLKTKLKGSPTADEKELILYCQKIQAYAVLERACVLLPEEMTEKNINYKMKVAERDAQKENRRRRLLDMAEKYKRDLQMIVARINEVEYELNPTHGLDPAKNHVNL